MNETFFWSNPVSFFAEDKIFNKILFLTCESKKLSKINEPD